MRRANLVFAQLETGQQVGRVRPAYVQCEEIDEATSLLGDAGQLAAGNSSARLTERLQQARAQLQPWQHTTAVRELDDRLTSCAIA